MLSRLGIGLGTLFCCLMGIHCGGSTAAETVNIGTNTSPVPSQEEVEDVSVTEDIQTDSTLAETTPDSEEPCIPDCEEGYSSSIQNFTCHQGELVSFPITEEARCDPNPCTLPVESGGECTDGTVSSGAFCEVRCLDTQLRPNVTRFECFAGTLIAKEAVHQSLVASSPSGSFECNRPCNVATATCLEGTLFVRSLS